MKKVLIAFVRADSEVALCPLEFPFDECATTCGDLLVIARRVAPLELGAHEAREYGLETTYPTRQVLQEEHLLSAYATDTPLRYVRLDEVREEEEAEEEAEGRPPVASEDEEWWGAVPSFSEFLEEMQTVRLKARPESVSKLLGSIRRSPFFDDVGILDLLEEDPEEQKTKKDDEEEEAPVIRPKRGRGSRRVSVLRVFE